MSNTVRLLWPERFGNYQFFREWFALAWSETGGDVLANTGSPFKLRQLVSKLGLVRQVISPAPDKEKLLVLCGGFPDYFVWPFSYGTEVIPFLWDVWPKYWTRLFRSLRRNKISMAFCTSSLVAELITLKVPGCRGIWIPEGIDTRCYPVGRQLRDRTVDVLELGRVFRKYHDCIVPVAASGGIRHLVRLPDTEPLFTNIRDLAAGLGNSKITVCFPRCDTHPEMAGSVETLTQRYWECMLTRTVIIGRAPKELVQFLGFNPVIDVDWSDPAGQLQKMITHIADYQNRVDEYRLAALEKGDWRTRMSLIREEFSSEGKQGLQTCLQRGGV